MIVYVPCLDEYGHAAMHVAVDLSNLPMPSSLINLFVAEGYPFDRWFDFARAYLANGNEEAFINFCEESLSAEIVNGVTQHLGKRPIYQEIEFHCGLAQLMMTKARRETQQASRQALFTKAGDYLIDARKIDDTEQLVHLGLGMLYLAKGDQKSAREELLVATRLTNNSKKNISGYLALAALSFSKNPKESLSLYRKALSESPGCPAEVRLGIASCLLKIGDIEAAKTAYDRVIELDPSCPDAHLGLAIIKFASSNIQQGLADGMKLLLRAYELDPTHAGTLSLLAHYSLLRGDYEKSSFLARTAIDSCEVDASKAEPYCILGRACHAMGSLNDAQKAYANVRI